MGYLPLSTYLPSPVAVAAIRLYLAFSAVLGLCPNFGKALVLTQGALLRGYLPDPPISNPLWLWLPFALTLPSLLVLAFTTILVKAVLSLKGPRLRCPLPLSTYLSSPVAFHRLWPLPPGT